MQADQGLCLFMLEGPLFYIMANIITHFCVKFIYGPVYEILVVITYAQKQGFFQQFWEKAPGQNWEKND